MDLFRPADEAALVRARQLTISLMQRFRFVRECLKCSAKNLLRVDEVFEKAQHAVLYPFTPLYDLSTGRYTETCKRAFERIFRMHDKDNDGLLSNAELDVFQNQTFQVPLVEKDLQGWKKVVHRNNPFEEPVVKDGKFTVAGFLAIFDVFISQNRLDVPWRVLRKFGYDDELNLHIPPSVEAQLEDGHWKLSSSARRFLAATFAQFDSNHDGVLSPEDVATIFSILPEPSLPPWHPVRAPKVFEGCFSLPKAVLPPSSSSGNASGGSSEEGLHEEEQPMALSQSLSASGITICSASSLPTVDISSSSSSTLQVSQPMTFLDWIGQWHMIAAISPSIARAELFRLGHVEKRDSKRRRRKNSMGGDSLKLPSKEVRVLVLGSRGSGKTALLNCLTFAGASSEASSGSGMPSPTETASTTKPETTTTCIKMKKQTVAKEEDAKEFAVHLVFTEVPEASKESDARKQKAELKHIVGSPSNKNRFCDLVVFCFDSSKEDSLTFAKELEEELLSDDVARIYVATKGEAVDDAVLNAAKEHCTELDLESPLVTSATESMLGSTTDPAAAKARSDLLQQLAKCVLEEKDGVDQLRSKPHAEKKRKEAAKRRKMIWLGGLVGVSVAVAVGVGVLWGGVGKGGERKGRFGWLRHILGGGIVGGSSSSTATAQS